MIRRFKFQKDTVEDGIIKPLMAMGFSRSKFGRRDWAKIAGPHENFHWALQYEDENVIFFTYVQTATSAPLFTVKHGVYVRMHVVGKDLFDLALLNLAWKDWPREGRDALYSVMRANQAKLYDRPIFSSSGIYQTAQFVSIQLWIPWPAFHRWRFREMVKRANKKLWCIQKLIEDYEFSPCLDPTPEMREFVDSLREARAK